MDSMNRSEASSSHHQSKVVLTNQGTESNSKQVNLSGYTLNNNTISNKKQQNQQAPQNSSQTSCTQGTSVTTISTSDINKDSNFEYDDNEWDVGIGDLIIDLDADIEKSSVVNQQEQKPDQLSHPENSSQNQSSSTSFQENNNTGLKKSDSILTNDSTGEGIVKQNLPSDNTKHIISKVTAAKKGITSSAKQHSSDCFPSSSLSPSLVIPGQQYHQQHHHNTTSSDKNSGNRSENISKHSVLLSQLNNKHSNFTSLLSSGISTLKQHSSSGSSSSIEIESSKSIEETSSTIMSSTTSNSGGKSATKIAVDHQATLDKGLKMKIKRTKPGTKTSEAKHEIVKAEQNGTNSLTSSNSEESISSGNNSGSLSSSKKHSSQSQPQPQQQVTSPSISQQQGTKRGGSGHRREKTKEKTTHHNQREKNEHNNNSSSGGSAGSSTSSSGDKCCNCTHDIQVNGVQQPCTNASCIRSRTTDPSITLLTQRLSTQNNSSTSSSTSSLFTSSNTGPSMNSSNTPNTPGPPLSKDNTKHSSASGGNGNGGSSSGNSSTGNNNSSCSSTNASSTNNALKSQLQSSTPPSNLINALSSVSAVSTCASTVSTPGSCLVTAGSFVGVTESSTIESNSTLIREDKGSSPPPAKRPKCDPKDMVDVCVGTSVGTITEPDCLGPCEPGTSVTLEGIVWHETEGGVLVVNVTWRGKTYVGTLIDCTKHDWAPPRFCDSPTEEFDSRTPKGRGKRGRNSTLFPVNDLSNFTETRSSMHSKLRNGGTKGRGGRGTTTTAESSSTKTTTTTSTTTANSLCSSSTSTSVSSNTPSTSPVAFLPPRPEKRKSKDEPPSPLNGGGSVGASGSSSNSSGTSLTSSNSAGSSNVASIVNNGTTSAQSVVVNPMTGLNVQISTKKCKSTSPPCAISPVLLECPEQDCSKKYKHANGLRYHQSHAHGSVSSMDEDSSQPPESPQRVAPPTTPSPSPTVQLVNFPSAPPTTASSPLSANNTANAIAQPNFDSVSSTNLLVANSVAITQSTSISSITTTTTSTTSCTTATNSPVPAASLLMVVNVSTATASSPTTSHSSIANVSTATLTTQSTTQHTVTSLAVAGGSITTGIAGQHTQQMQHTVLGSSGNQTLLSTALTGNQNGSGLPAQLSGQGQTQVQPLQSNPLSQVNNNNGSLSTPARCEPTPKSKSGVLRFGPLPTTNDTDHSQRLTPATGPSVSSPGALQTSVAITTNLSALPPVASGPHESLNIKAQNCSKQKKNRKSPGPSEFDVAASSRAEDVQSPAYSDISDDSTPVIDTGDLDKSKAPQQQDAAKKCNESNPGQMGPLSGYGIYPYYPGMQHQSQFFSTDHSGKPSGLGHSPLGPNATSVDYKSSKEPPLDLMNKPIQQPQPPPPSSQPVHQQQMASEVPNAQPNKDSAIGPPSNHPGAGKMMQHFYPYGYMPTGFGYNLDPNYVPVPIISEENKLSQQQQSTGQIKEERIKESPSPNEYVKLGPQMVPSKLIKSEPVPVKDIKTESGHSLHPKDQPPSVQQPGQPPLSAYGGMFQRHGLNVGPPAQHINREDDLRRLFNYSDQRRSGTTNSSAASNLNPKEESPSPSHSQPGHPNHGSVHVPSSSQSTSNTSQQQSQHQQHKGSKNSPAQPQIKQPKEIKSEEKETLKVKQEGQKPTMETQGPPPPPTSQYYPHSLYMSAAPFGFDPNHQMYRNMLVPAASYSAPPYHLQIPRYTTPEDLSRNPSTKALDLLQHHASQYYNSHKIHELREGALKSPTSNVKVSVSSPNLSQQTSQNPNMCIPPSNSSISSSGLSLQQQQQAPSSTHPQQQPPGAILQPSQAAGTNVGNNPGGGGVVGGPEQQKEPGGPAGVMGSGPALPGGPPQAGQPPGGTRSPPPQRHVHTHHHTHVGLGYPMFQAPYGAAVLASQQAAAAVTVISPFQTGPPAK